MTALARWTVLASAVLPLYTQTVDASGAAHARAAQEAERRDDFATAVHEYELAVRTMPQSAELRSNLGVALYFNRELPQAITVLRKAMTLKPDLLAPHLFTGLALYRLSDPDGAVPELKEAVRINPSDVLSRTWLGYAYVAQARYDLALEEFQAASRLDPSNVDIWYALGQTDLEVGKQATQQLLALAPDGARVWQLAAEQAELQGDPRKALEDYQGAFIRRSDLPEIPSAIARLGGTVQPVPAAVQVSHQQEDELYLQAHEAERSAREAFEHVVQLAPDSYRAHQILGDSLSAEQKLGEANAEYRTVLRAKPDLPGVHEAIGRNLLHLGKTDEALGEFQAELQLQPRSASAHAYAGQAFLLMGNEAEARKMLSSALQLDRPPLDTYRLLGKLDVRQKNYRAAINALEHYVSLQKDDASAFYLLSKAYAGVSDQQRAKSALEAFEKTSRDAKTRNKAQNELASFSGSHGEADEPADVSHGPGQ